MAQARGYAGTTSMTMKYTIEERAKIYQPLPRFCTVGFLGSLHRKEPEMPPQQMRLSVHVSGDGKLDRD